MEDRPISEPEATVVEWLLKSASVVGPLDHLVPSVPRLRVVGRCTCGCASVDFEPSGQAGGSRPIADAVGEAEPGKLCGLILWGRDDAITGLEVYELSPGSNSTLPPVASLKPWDKAGGGRSGRAP
ncbi:MAG: hypothetical protein HY907_17775 [Deltaproteobacteria bacterium]|nr:hypothetical protein [Deltaproteobacteria bacterium]